MNDHISLAIRQAGVIARQMQGRVANEGKADDTALPNDDDALRARRAAKTAIDEIVQDVLLLAASEEWGTGFTLDAEEETPGTKLFTTSGDSSTLVVDPIDGTIEYLEGRDSYSICIGLTSQGIFRPLYVYFPARGDFYHVSSDGRAFVSAKVGLSQTDLRPIEPNPTSSKIIYINGRVPGDLQKELTALGFVVIDDTVDGRGAPDCLIECLHGKALCYLSHTRQMRDIMLGAVIGAVDTGYALDWSSRSLIWPSGGRVPRAMFGIGSPPSDVLDVISRYA